MAMTFDTDVNNNKNLTVKNDASKIIVSSPSTNGQVVGTTLPASGTEGQVFFKVI